MIGLPVTARTESAAPPRASPSSLVISDAVEVGGLGEALGDVDGVLAGHRVDDQQHVVRLGHLPHLGELVHQVLVDVQAAGGVDDQDVAVVLHRLVARPGGHLDGVGLTRLGVDVGLRLGAELLELLDRSRPLQVAGGQGDVLVLLLQQLGELGAGGRLARALEPGHQDHGRPAGGEDEVAARAAHQLGELVVDGLDHGLAGVERLGDLLAREPLPQRGGEVLDDLEVDVGLEQREADLAQGLVDVVLGELAPRANIGEHALEAL